MIAKKLIPTNDSYIQFTEEELVELNMQPGDKFSVRTHGDGSIELRKYVPVELDIENWSRETLMALIRVSIEDDITINDAINNILRNAIEADGLEDVCLSHSDTKDPVLLKECAGIDPNFTNNDTSITNN